MFAKVLPESLIKGFSIRARELGAINLGQGIPAFKTADHILAAAKVALDDPGIGVYPNFLGEIALRNGIAQKLTHELGDTSIDAGQILVTVGGMEATASAVLSIVNAGDRVLELTPDYCNHLPQILLAKGVPVDVPLKEADHRWQLDHDALTKEAQSPFSLLIMTNPGNPTGVVYTDRDMVSIIDQARKHNAWILADETYSYLVYGQPFVSLLSYRQQYDKILVVRSFSKEYCMTGWRVGYLVSQKEQLDMFAKTHDALAGCAPKISQRAAIAALEGDQQYIRDHIDYYQRNRQIARESLQNIPGISLSLPMGAYYAFPRYDHSGESRQLSERLLTEYGVVVIPGSAFGRGGEGHFRISFAVDTQVLKAGLTKIAQFFTANHGK